ncbi:MAG: metal ABC transporter permease [bacterium]|nr:metal ABC transporter permease [bacterium]
MDIFRYTFMQYALINGIFIGILCPLIGVFLVLKNLSLIADGVAHFSFGGIALGIILGFSPNVMILVFSIVGALLVNYIVRRSKLYGDTAIAILLSTGLALGITIISMAKGTNFNINSYLFGSLLAIDKSELVFALSFGIPVIILVLLLYKPLLYITFDEDSARASGLPVEMLNTLLVLIGAITVAITIRIAGILLASALVVIPVATGMQVSKSFKGALLSSIIFGVISVILGLFLSYYLNIAPGGAIVLVNVLIFLMSLSRFFH